MKNLYLILILLSTHVVHAAEQKSAPHICPYNPYTSSCTIDFCVHDRPANIDAFIDIDNPESEIHRILETYNPNRFSSHDYTLPHTAAAHGKDKTLIALIKVGMPLDTVDSQRHLTPLHYAIINHHTSTSALLLQHGADKDAPAGVYGYFSNPGATPLHAAVRVRNISGIVQLLVAGADPNKAMEYGYTPLHKVARHYLSESSDDKSMLWLLLHANTINPNAQDYRQRTPLHKLFWSASRDHDLTAAIELFTQHGANPNIQDWQNDTPLHQVLLMPEPNIPSIQALLKAEARCDIRNNSETAYDIAMREENPAVRELFLQAQKHAVETGGNEESNDN